LEEEPYEESQEYAQALPVPTLEDIDHEEASLTPSSEMSIEQHIRESDMTPCAHCLSRSPHLCLTFLGFTPCLTSCHVYVSSHAATPRPPPAKREGTRLVCGWPGCGQRFIRLYSLGRHEKTHQQCGEYHRWKRLPQIYRDSAFEPHVPPYLPPAGVRREIGVLVSRGEARARPAVTPAVQHG
jgi:hypothetical protein